jgi:hypothetical protein
VDVSEEQFLAAMRTLVAQTPFPIHLGVRTRHPRVVTVAAERLSHVELALARDYRFWCERRYQRGDCLGLLRDRPVLGPAERYQLAFHFALGSQWDGFASELRGLADPASVRIVLLSAMVGYMMLLAIPELVTKGIAAGLALALTAYLGAEAVWNLVAGWIQMVREADAAITFWQLREAGERYGKAVGAQTARLLVMLVTAILSEGGLPARMLGLPGAMQAQLALAKDTSAVGLGAVGQATSAIATEAGVTVVLGPVATGAQALAMAAAKNSGGSTPTAPPPPAEPPVPSYKSFDAFKRAKGPPETRRSGTTSWSSTGTTLIDSDRRHSTTRGTSSGWTTTRI